MVSVIKLVLLSVILQHVQILKLSLGALELCVGRVVVADLGGVRAFVRSSNQFALDSLPVLAHDLVILFACRIRIVLPHVCYQIVFTFN